MSRSVSKETIDICDWSFVSTWPKRRNLDGTVLGQIVIVSC